MTDPLVACIMLTKDRPEMAKRAVESFRRQTYQNKRLIVVDNVAEPNRPTGIEEYYAAPPSKFGTIGSLRNLANKFSECNIVIHFDDDDWSHPNRITEQVALLQASGKQCVGYRDMLFWKSSEEVLWADIRLDIERTHTVMVGGRLERYRENVPFDINSNPLGEAWLYANQDPRYCLGTSLCYWRAAWEARPFPDISRGEDRKWLREIDSLGVSSIPAIDRAAKRDATSVLDYQARLIASIHSGNHVKYETTSAEWERVPEWDAYCRERMAL